MMEQEVRSIYDYPEYYDTTSPGSPGDVAFYVDQAKRGQGPVLEVGCGTGRVLIPMSEAGLTATGIDNSSAMLQHASARVNALPRAQADRIDLVLADMRSLQLEGKYKTILLPYRVFLHLYTPEEQIETLLGLKNLLDVGGRLVISIFDPDLKTIASFASAPSHRLLRTGQLPSGNSLITW
ncbi:MAG: class I SAM-dependent methyltransferase, partial [Gemmatimonadaceae bacterium]